MRRIVCCLLAMICCSVFADDAGNKQIKDYEGLLRLGAFSCKLKQNNYEASMQLGSTQQDASRSDLMACISEYSDKAKNGLTNAVKAAKTDSLKSAVKNLYTEWNAYFGNFDRISEARFDRARSALDTELLLAQ